MAPLLGIVVRLAPDGVRLEYHYADAVYSSNAAFGRVTFEADGTIRCDSDDGQPVTPWVDCDPLAFMAWQGTHIDGQEPQAGGDPVGA